MRMPCYRPIRYAIICRGVGRHSFNYLRRLQANYNGHESWIFVYVTPPKAVIPSLIPVKNPLPNGSYRIRSFNGSYLLTMPDTAQKKKHQDRNVFVSTRKTDTTAAKFQKVSRVLCVKVHNADSPFIQWEVERGEDTGLYTIKNVGSRKYLGPPGGSGTRGDSLVGVDKSFSQWIIQTTDMGVIFLWVY